MHRVFNFSAGPGALPLEVLEKAQKELVCYGDSGMSVMEMSHRSKDYDAIIKDAEARLRKVMGIPDNYKVLFLQGGASLQFAMIPLNLLRKSFKADYIESGQFSSKALKEAQKYGKINVVGSSKADNYTYIPKVAKEQFDPEADYAYICANNTIYGTKFHEYPDTGNVPLVADMSSCILSEEVDVNKFGIIYAGAQKNLGPAGVTLVIIREDLIGHANEKVPSMLNYQLMADNDSMYNTPPTYGIYMLKLMFEWIENQGGVAALEKRNKEKAALLYDYLDQSKLFKATAKKEDRSMMNVTFVTGDADLDAKFVKEAAKEGLVSIKGHRSVGGMRASIYNAMPKEGVQKLVDFMTKFESENL
ncbi:MAG: 3-phosphoserine/phosphohydroxythreonine transaminase [Cellulosilyticum sp.]|nr:3-phosphoserine/phosphohydroxythreonine transaminase [Cellulosilyticum sp.]